VLFDQDHVPFDERYDGDGPRVGDDDAFDGVAFGGDDDGAVQAQERRP
jgi:hypothetical protein